MRTQILDLGLVAAALVGCADMRRGLPEGVVFSQDGRHLYVGNFIDRTSRSCPSKAIASSPPASRSACPTSRRYATPPQ